MPEHKVCGTKGTVHFNQFNCTLRHSKRVLRVEIACGRQMARNPGEFSKLDKRGN